MKIVLLDEAQERFEVEDRWWREHRDARELFVTEFERRCGKSPRRPELVNATAAVEDN